MAKIAGWQKDLDLPHVTSWDTTRLRYKGVPEYQVTIQRHDGRGTWFLTVDQASEQLSIKEYATKAQAKKQALAFMRRHS